MGGMEGEPQERGLEPISSDTKEPAQADQPRRASLLMADLGFALARWTHPRGVLSES
jgi:hypothetical protein